MPNGVQGLVCLPDFCVVLSYYIYMSTTIYNSTYIRRRICLTNSTIYRVIAGIQSAMANIQINNICTFIKDEHSHTHTHTHRHTHTYILQISVYVSPFVWHIFTYLIQCTRYNSKSDRQVNTCSGRQRNFSQR